ncbi:MAG: SdpI family protein [Lachnospiraceae bacterium]|nr:SdpI family protein [Lachnospiraceae bacterium]
MEFLLLLNLIVPFVMILVGFMLKKHPVSDMKSNNGYNTPTSRKSQEHWNYAQSIAPDIFISLGYTLGSGTLTKQAVTI